MSIIRRMTTTKTKGFTVDQLCELTPEEKAAHAEQRRKAIAARDEAAAIGAKLEIVESQIRAIDRQRDEAVAEHQQATSPIQARLDELNRQLLDGDPDGKISRERDELLAKLTEANNRLESKLPPANIVRHPLTGFESDESQRGVLQRQAGNLRTQHQHALRGVLWPKDPSLSLAKQSCWALQQNLTVALHDAEQGERGTAERLNAYQADPGVHGHKIEATRRDLRFYRGQRRALESVINVLVARNEQLGKELNDAKD